MKILRGLLLACSSLVSVAFGQLDFGFAAPQQKLVATTATASVGNYTADSPFYIALTAELTPPWHAYYRNPATVGMPMQATLKAPEGFKVEGPFWKVPMRDESASGVSYGYSAPLLVWRLTPETNAPSEASFSVSSSIQVCSGEGCMPPESEENTLTLSKGEPTTAAGWNEALLAEVEVLGDTPLELNATQTNDEVLLRVKSDTPITEAYFFSDDNSISPTAGQKLEQVEGGCILHLPRNDGKDMMYPVADESTLNKPLAAIKGVLRYGDKHCRVNIELTSALSTMQNASGASAALTSTSANTTGNESEPHAAMLDGSLLTLFGALFLGGLILNLMPCVFPVIGLKIMSFVELGGGSRRKVFMHSLAFVLGVLISFWVLSMLLIVFSNLEALAQTPWQQWTEVLLADAGAGSRSWAEWMQSDWVVYLILLLLLAMGLSMYGVFEIGVGATGAGQGLQNKKGYAGSFFSGLFVTVVATPCSGPFLGAAMPAAMALPGLMMVAALTFMALGLAAPYIVLGAFPSLVRLLPRPGAWMESLKQGLSFLLFAAAAWFLDIYLAFVADTQTMVVFISLVGVCAAFWVYGRWCPIYRSKLSRVTGGIIALALLTLSVWGSMPRAAIAEATPAPSADAAEPGAYVVATASAPVWNEWSPALMEQALEDGHPVYVDFTAKWCATCQANKKVAYTDEVYARMAEAEVVLMRADKTRPNPTIDSEMRKLKRSAVPVNALYSPDGEVSITRELLTAPYLIEWLDEQFLLNDESTEDAPAESE